MGTNGMYLSVRELRERGSELGYWMVSEPQALSFPRAVWMHNLLSFCEMGLDLFKTKIPAPIGKL